MGKNLMVYVSKNGTTGETVKKIREKLSGRDDFHIVNLKEEKPNNIEGYDKVYLGCGIYAGTFPKEMREFMNNNGEKLKEKKCTFFLHGLGGDAHVREYIEKTADKAEWFNDAVVRFLGGKIDIKKQNFLIRLFFRGIARKEGLDYNNMDNLRGYEIEKFIEGL